MDSGKGEDCPELSIPQFHNPQPGDENVGNLLWVSIIHLLILHIPYRAFLSQDSIGRGGCMGSGVFFPAAASVLTHGHPILPYFHLNSFYVMSKSHIRLWV